MAKSSTPVEGGLAKIMALKPKANGKRYGLVPDDMEKVLPDLVRTSRTPEVSSGKGKSISRSQGRLTKGIDYSALIPILIAAIQEQQAKIEALERGRK